MRVFEGHHGADLRSFLRYLRRESVLPSLAWGRKPSSRGSTLPPLPAPDWEVLCPLASLKWQALGA